MTQIRNDNRPRLEDYLWKTEYFARYRFFDDGGKPFALPRWNKWKQMTTENRKAVGEGRGGSSLREWHYPNEGGRHQRGGDFRTALC